MRRALDLVSTPLGLAGAAIATVTAALILILFALQVLGFAGSPYLGILAYLVLPAFFVGGLLLIPLAAWRDRRHRAAAPGAGERAPALPVIDFNSPRTRRVALVVFALTIANVGIVALATYEAVHVMDTPAFCGSCHSVMDPEHATYRRSPHARVACVDCHIGPGAPWFVKSKLSGAWQVVSVAFDLYPRPIPTPVESLRPARDTCEQCHWPARFAGDLLRIRTHHAGDEASTRRETVLLMHVGGAPRTHAEAPGPAAAAAVSGIHWHVAQGVTIRYLSDRSRMTIGVVDLERPGGTRETFRAPAGPQQETAGASWRVMDCVDCHNRPTHVFQPAADALDEAIAADRIDRALPFVRREGLRVLEASYASHDEARRGIHDALVTYYSALPGFDLSQRAGAVEQAAAALADAWAVNVWPSMRIGWGTYPSFAGHEQTPGCWRCHDDAHATEGGRKISQDCDLCHAILAQDETSPDILKRLGVAR